MEANVGGTGESTSACCNVLTVCVDCMPRQHVGLLCQTSPRAERFQPSSFFTTSPPPDNMRHLGPPQLLPLPHPFVNSRTCLWQCEGLQRRDG